MQKQPSEYSERDHPVLDRGVAQLATIIKRDFCVALGFFVCFVILEKYSSLGFVRVLPAAIICITILWFMVRVYRFARYQPVSKCPDCGSDLELESHGDERDLVCHQCHLRFLRYRPSSDPDRIFEVVSKSHQNTQIDKAD